VLIVKILFLLIIDCLLFCGCKSGISEVMSKSGYYFDTVVEISLYEGGSEEIINNCFSLCAEYEDIFSPTRKTSELYRLNKQNENPDNNKMKYELSDTLADAVGLALEYCRESNGRFDITIRPVCELWDFTGNADELPEPSLISEKIKLVDYNAIKIEGNKLSFEFTGMKIDLGAVAKGYIADRLKEYLISEGVSSAIINLGGNVLCIGGKGEKDSFNIGIQLPFADNGINDVVKIRDKSVVTSGVYQRYFIKDDILYHHVLDSATGYPVKTDIVSVSVVSDESVTGDILSTVILVSGEKYAEELIKENKALGVMLIYSDGRTVYYGEFENLK